MRDVTGGQTCPRPIYFKGVHLREAEGGNLAQWAKAECIHAPLMKKALVLSNTYSVVEWSKINTVAHKRYTQQTRTITHCNTQRN